MKNQKSKLRKLAKKNKRLKNYKKLINIKRNNWKTTKYAIEKPIILSVIEVNGSITSKQIGKKKLWQSAASPRIKAGQWLLPKSRKVRLTKTQRKQEKKGIINRIAQSITH